LNIVITFTEQRDVIDGGRQCSISAELDTLLEGEPSLEAVIFRLRAAAAAALAEEPRVPPPPPGDKPEAVHALGAPERPRLASPKRPSSSANHARSVATETPAAAAPRERTGRELWEEVKDAGPKLDWFVALGKRRGWPPLLVNWSPLMVREARAQWYAPDRPLPTDRRADAARA
jgi:hypothetical protein